MADTNDFDCLAQSPLFEYAFGIPFTDSDNEEGSSGYLSPAVLDNEEADIYQIVEKNSVATAQQDISDNTADERNDASDNIDIAQAERSKEHTRSIVNEEYLEFPQEERSEEKNDDNEEENQNNKLALNGEERSKNVIHTEKDIKNLNDPPDKKNLEHVNSKEIVAFNDKNEEDIEENAAQANSMQTKRYNLRNKIKQIKDQRFNKQHYEYQDYKKKSRKTQQEYVEAICHLLKKAKDGKSYDSRTLQKNVMGLSFLQYKKVSMTQMSAREGIKRFGDNAIEALSKEYSQLDNLRVFAPADALQLTMEQKEAALNAIDLIKHKRCGCVKGVLSLEGFITSVAIDAMEKRDMAITDVAGAFLKADMPDYVLLRLHGLSLQAIICAN